MRLLPSFKKKKQITEKRSLAEGQKTNTELIRSVTNARARKKLVVALTAAALICLAQSLAMKHSTLTCVEQHLSFKVLTVYRHLKAGSLQACWQNGHELGTFGEKKQQNSSFIYVWRPFGTAVSWGWLLFFDIETQLWLLLWLSTGYFHTDLLWLL